MPKYKLRLRIETPEHMERLTLKLPLSVKSDLEMYGSAVEAESNARPTVDVLIVKMLEDYLDSDKAFQQFKKNQILQSQCTA